MLNLITYDLRQPGRDYTSLYESIKSLGRWAHPVESVWITDTSQSPADIRDTLKDHVDGNDMIFVVQLRQHWASSNLDASVTDWLKDSSRSW
jgi:hypothetical protein